MVLNVPCSWAISVGSRRGVQSRGGGMFFRTAGAVATLLIGLAGSGGQALAQYYPPPQAYPPPPAYPPANVYPPQRQLPPMSADDDAKFYEPPPVYGLPAG